MALLQRVLTIIARILLGICAVAGVACLVYTLSTAAVQAGFNSAKDAVASLVDQAEASLGAGVTSAVAGVAPASGAAGADASAVEPAAAGADAAPEADASAAAYQRWSDAVSQPLERVFAQTGIDASTLEGAAGGSTQALSALTSLSDDALATVNQNASNLGATASAHEVPSELPDDVRAQLAQADAHVAAFCEDARKLTDAARTLRDGNVLAASGVTSAAYAARSELEGADACVAKAQELLGM